MSHPKHVFLKTLCGSSKPNLLLPFENKHGVWLVSNNEVKIMLVHGHGAQELQL